MKKGKKIYEGKAKILYTAPDHGTAIQHFKDEATAFNNLKKSTIEGKGILNNRISEHILSSLNQIGIETHLIKRINMREQLVKLVEIIQKHTKQSFSKNIDLVELIKKDKLINKKISLNKIKNIFNYSKHFKYVNYIFRRVFK